MNNDHRRPRNIPTGDTPRPGVGGVRLPRIPIRPRTGEDLHRISWRLEPRDYVLAQLLDEHRFLTTDQIAAALFGSIRTCRNRLNTLRRLGFITWFMPVHPVRGRLPVHWIPGPLSARYVALHRGERPPSTRAVRDLEDSHAAVTAGGHVDHADGVNQFFIDLITHSRTHPDTRLTRWWSSTHIAKEINHNTRPDAHGVWREHDRQVAFFLEHDTGAPSHPQRAAKLTGYRTVRDRGGPAWPILFWLPTTTIEEHLHRHLNQRQPAGRGLIVATAARDHATGHGGPAGPVWRIVGNGRRRLRLSELPNRITSGGAYHPGPPTPTDDPLYLLGTTP